MVMVFGVPLAARRFDVDDVLERLGDLGVAGELCGAHLGLERVDLVEGALELVDEHTRLVEFLDRLHFDCYDVSEPLVRERVESIDRRSLREPGEDVLERGRHRHWYSSRA